MVWHSINLSHILNRTPMETLHYYKQWNRKEIKAEIMMNSSNSPPQTPQYHPSLPTLKQQPFHMSPSLWLWNEFEKKKLIVEHDKIRCSHLPFIEMSLLYQSVYCLQMKLFEIKSLVIKQRQKSKNKFLLNINWMIKKLPWMLRNKVRGDLNLSPGFSWVDKASRVLIIKGI